jgi:hypothetical protein
MRTNTWKTNIKQLLCIAKKRCGSLIDKCFFICLYLKIHFYYINLPLPFIIILIKGYFKYPTIIYYLFVYAKNWFTLRYARLLG